MPAAKHAIFPDPGHHFQPRDTYIIYDNYWDLFAPIEGVPVAGVLEDYAHIKLCGLDVEGLYRCPASPSRNAAWPSRCPARTNAPSAAPPKPSTRPDAWHAWHRTEYNYNDLGGAVNAFYAAADLRRLHPDVLLPSLGGSDAGKRATRPWPCSKITCRHSAPVGPRKPRQIAAAGTPALQKVTDHVWCTTHTESINWFVISDSGKALVIDYGYHAARGLLSAEYSKPYRRRALCTASTPCTSRFGIDRINVALISHFHDDHVCGVPLLQRLFDKRCWASADFAHLLASPGCPLFPMRLAATDPDRPQHR